MASSRHRTATHKPDRRARTAKPSGAARPSRSAGIVRLQHAAGNLATSALVQAKLCVNEPGDLYEQEADRVADAVLRMPGPTFGAAPSVGGPRPPTAAPAITSARALSPPPSQPLQRVCAECEHELQRQVDENEDEAMLQAKGGARSGAGGAPVPQGAAGRIDSLRGGGQPLPDAARSFFEPRFGYDFSSVRVHMGGQAADAARAVNARAFTVGSDVVFGAGEYAPGTEAGRRLLGHELVHVVQQSRSGEAALRRSPRDQQVDSRPTLRKGDKRSAVRTLQELLNSAQLVPLAPISIDGKFGPATEFQVRVLQRRQGLVADGIVGPQTWKALYATGQANEASSSITQRLADAVQDRYSQAEGCALTRYTSNTFVNKVPVIDKEFVAEIKKIEAYAESRDVKVFITDSFRAEGRAVRGAIVRPARMSNHKAGHAIDMNLRHAGRHYNSKKLTKSKLSSQPEAISEFIKDIQTDPGLRWGGDFSKKEDPVHIDDHLNARRKSWQERFDATQAARQSGCG